MQQAQFSIHDPKNKNLTNERAIELNQRLLSIHPDYIWFNEPFKFTDIKMAQIKGELSFGDCIDDEWFLVHLLKRISEENQDLVISIRDEDGEFLLIEAALQLDSSLSPDNCDDRVYIQGGNLHIIPLSMKFNSVTEAVGMVLNQTADTVAPFAVQDSAFSRPNQFEKGIEHIFHCARVLLPLPLASALYKYPELISKIVSCLYTRDDTLLKSSKRNKMNHPELVEMNLRFTKILYAQLCSIKIPAIDECEFGADLKLGLKLVIGCDIFRQSWNSTNFESDKWQDYLQNLKKMGYFRGEMEGSQLYNVYLNLAQQNFVSDKTSANVEFESILANNLEQVWNQDLVVDKSLLLQGKIDDDSYLDASLDGIDQILREKNVFNSDDDFVNQSLILVEYRFQ